MANQNPLEIVFFDLETTFPIPPSSRRSLLEFGSVTVCARNLVEVGSYSTLICPNDLNSISEIFFRRNGITRETMANSPSFSDVADQIFNTLNGRIWAGHNIMEFDCLRIREAFAEIGKMAPEAKGIIDTFPLLAQNFGNRAGDMKLANMASYFGLGQQMHRSLADVRMNLEVLKCCATLLYLESTFPDMFPTNCFVENTTNRENNEIHASIIEAEGSSSHAQFLEHTKISLDCISVSQVRFRNCVLHNGVPLQICSYGIRVQFGVDTCNRYLDYAGRPKLDIVVNVPENLCPVLDACERAAQKSTVDSGSSSKWRPTIINECSNSPSARLHLTIANDDSIIYSTEIWKKNPYGSYEKHLYSKTDTAVVKQLFVSGTILDAYYSLDVYDYQQHAGIRLVAKRLVVHSM